MTDTEMTNAGLTHLQLTLNFRFENQQKQIVLSLDRDSQTSIRLHEQPDFLACLEHLGLDGATNHRISLASLQRNKSELLAGTLRHFELRYMPQYGMLVFVYGLVVVFPCEQTQLKFDFIFERAQCTPIDRLLVS